MADTDNRESVRCQSCGLAQFAQDLCRRCHKPLPQPIVRIVERLVDETFAPTAPVIPLRELTRRAVVHALKKSSSVQEAASRLKIGKTTLYRMLEEFGIATKREARNEGTPVPEADGLPPEQNYLFVEDGVTDLEREQPTRTPKN